MSLNVRLVNLDSIRPHRESKEETQFPTVMTVINCFTVGMVTGDHLEQNTPLWF